MGPQNVAPDGLSYVQRAICLKSSLEAHLPLCNLAQESQRHCVDPVDPLEEMDFSPQSPCRATVSSVYGNLAFSAIAAKISPSASQMQEQALST